MRLIGGLLGVGFGLMWVAATVVLGWNPWVRLAALPFFFGGISGIFQWRDKT